MASEGHEVRRRAPIACTFCQRRKVSTGAETCEKDETRVTDSYSVADEM